MGAQQARHLLEQRGCRDPVSTLSALQGLAFGTDQRAVSSAGQRWFERILPSILDLAPQLPFPDEAIRYLDGFLTATKGRTLVYELLAGHPSVLRMLLFAFASGPVLARSLIAHPEWFDELLETGAASAGYDVADQESRVVNQVLSARDDESAWRRLRIWKEKTSLILGLLEVLNLEPEASLARKTSDLAEICLRAIATRIERNLARHLGSPAVESPSTGLPISWSILGFGGFGGRHVSHFSDLDIVLLFSEAGRVPATGMKAVEWFSRLGEELIGVMTAVSPDGQLFKVDARLRPEGRNAPLAAPLERYVTYYESTAQTWEWQAILKARVVAGDEALATRFLHSLWDFLPRRFSDRTALAEEISTMRERLAQSVKVPRWAEADYKRGRGGLVDVDFILQFLQLASMASESDPGARRRLAQPVVEEAVPILIETGALEQSDGHALLAEHEFLRTLQRRQRLLFETAKDFFPEKAERVDPLRRALAPFLRKVDPVERFHESRDRLRDLFARLVR
jgi:glutamate-ammonia-ligase adenylyltransferase